MAPSVGRWIGRGVVKGVATGLALLLGDVEIRSGRVVGQSSDLRGACLAGTVLMIPSTRGSAGAWRFLYQLKLHDTHPVAIAMRDSPDASVVQGAILAAIPIIAGLPDTLWDEIETGSRLSADGTEGSLTRLGAG